MSRRRLLLLLPLALPLGWGCGDAVPLAYEWAAGAAVGGTASGSTGGDEAGGNLAFGAGGAAGDVGVCDRGDKPLCVLCEGRLACDRACAEALECEAADREVRTCEGGLVRCYGKPGDWSASACPPCWPNNL